MATIAGHRLTLDPMGKCSNAFPGELKTIKIEQTNKKKSKYAKLQNSEKKT
jgi:hypothetical protein